MGKHLPESVTERSEKRAHKLPEKNWILHKYPWRACRVKEEKEF